MNPGDNDIPEMQVDKKYLPKMPVQNPSEIKKEMDKTKKELDKIKDFILKKFKFTLAISVLPAQIVPKFVEDEKIPKESEKFIQLHVLVPEDNFKEIPKIKAEIVKELEKMKEKVWLQVRTPVDIWEDCMDSRFELVSGVAISYPLFDTGILEGLRVAEIHKSLVLNKFDKYIVSYVIAGSLVRGDATKTSDVDVFIVINDTDVKRMPRLELKERLRGIIHQFIADANGMAGVQKNLLNIQVYLLTEFWEAVKDANPVMFTFIRDGVPMYDKGTFLPWKALLRMGKLKPSPESIDMFMSTGDKTLKRAKFALLDVLIHDIYWGILTPSQALLMLYGLPPPTPKQIVGEMKKTFVDKEKMLEIKYVNILERVVKAYKDYEHEKLKEVSGTELDKFIKDSEEYLKRLGELRTQIEKKTQEKTIEEIHDDTFNLLKSILGNKSQEKLIEEFEKELVKKGKFTGKHSRILQNIVVARKEFKKGKLDAHKVNDARKEASILLNDLIEYSQRIDLASMDKKRIILKLKKGGIAEVLAFEGGVFLFEGPKVKKITKDKISDSGLEEVGKITTENREKQAVFDSSLIDKIKKEVGDFEIVL